MSKIHYAVKIQTNGTHTDSSIGIDSGIMRYTTHGYAPSGDTYEDLAPVEGTWYGDILSDNGIKTSSSSIDIVGGGDYAFLSSLSISLVNYDQFHKKLLNNVNLVGSTMTMYCIIDGVWYTRWTGAVSEYTFDEKVISITGKDKNNSDNTTLKDYIFGYNNTVYVPIIKDEKPILTETFVKRVLPSGDFSISNWKLYSDSNIPYINGNESYFNGGTRQARNQVTSESKLYDIYLNGHHTKIVKDMYLKFNGDDQFYSITEVVTGAYPASGSVPQIKYTKVTIFDITDKIVGYEQFYGSTQEFTSPTVTDALKVADSSSLTISVYQKGLYFAPTEGTYVTDENGRYQARDKDGNLIYLEGTLNPDGSVTIITTQYTTIQKPKSISYFSVQDGDTFITEFNSGSAKHLESKFTSISVPNDNNPGGEFTKLPSSKVFYVKADFEDKLDGTPYVLLSSMQNSKEHWYSAGAGFTRYLNSPDYPISFPGGYHSDFTNSPLSISETAQSYFTEYEIGVSQVVNDLDSGMIAVSGAVGGNRPSIILPNVRWKTDVVNVGADFSITVKSAAVTNIPFIGLNYTSDEPFITTDNPVINWRNYNSVSNPSFTGYGERRFYPESVVEFEGITSAPTSTSNSLIFDITISSEGQDAGLQYTYRTPTTQTVCDLGWGNKASIGINSIGVYKINTIGSVEDITLSKHVPATDTLPKVLSDLSGTSVDLPNRNWTVGGQITEENAYTVITSMCKQSMVGGYTDRFGATKFKEITNDQ